MMERLNGGAAQGCSLYGVNTGMGEYGDAGVRSMMALMTAHEGQGARESIPSASSFSSYHVKAAEYLRSIFQPEKSQRQSVIQPHLLHADPVSSLPWVKTEGRVCPNRFEFHREQAGNRFVAEAESMNLVTPAVQAREEVRLITSLEADNPHFSISSRTYNTTDEEQEGEDAMKAKILAHPQYPCLLEAYVNCQKVGAPPEVMARLDAVSNDYHGNRGNVIIGMDPELDRFMEAYREMLVKYNEELSKPFKEAMACFKQIETQFNSLSNGLIRISPSAENDEKIEGGASSNEEDCSTGEMDYQEVDHRSEDRELKEHLLRKYSGYLSSLKKEFMKKKKKGKLPKDARYKLLDWWNLHYKWPYPSENEKVALAESTGLDQKQINNWFINQRKRHWKPSEDVQFLDGHSPHGAALYLDRDHSTEGSAFHLDC